MTIHGSTLFSGEVLEFRSQTLSSLSTDEKRTTVYRNIYLVPYCIAAKPSTKSRVSFSWARWGIRPPPPFLAE